MTKTVLFYARYSTDRQNEVSIETQVELGKTFVADRGWKLVETYADSAISGTSFTSRPGIQQLLAHVKRERIDVVLCVTVDRLSRDVEHSSKILKELNYQDTAIWTVQAGQPISHIELHMRSTLSHELVEQIRYRTREGMKTAARKGKATTRLCATATGSASSAMPMATGSGACARSNRSRPRPCAGFSSNMPTGSVRRR